jgi:two-component system, chemotaxis family, protein-glutamate methylesterase/glutaminase
MSKVRVLVVDDSASMRRLISIMLESDPRLEVIGVARNGVEALVRIKELKPDVVTLDINMPVMDGLTALSHIMVEQPTPCVMISSLTQEGANATMEALALGAIDFVGKPSGTVSLDLDVQSAEIIAKVRAAARANLQRPRPRPALNRPEPPRPVLSARLTERSPRVVAIGVSTGGPQTLLQILPFLPGNLSAPVAVVQHMPPRFTASLAKRLDDSCALKVKEAGHNEPLLPGFVYVAPGGLHMTIQQSTLARGPIAHLSDSPKGTQFCPSVGVLFQSVARLYGRRAVGVLLTGMGDDGADGMVQIRRGGGITIAESNETCVVFGMPREAIERGGAEIVSPNYDIADDICSALKRIK